MDYSSGAYPLAGFTNEAPSIAGFTMSRQTGVGPAGTDAIRLRLNNVGASGGDHSWGHGRVFPEAAPFLFGHSVFFTFYHRFVSGFNGRAYSQGGTGTLAGIWRNKVLIVHDAGSSSTARAIVTVEVNRDPYQWFLKLQKGGGVDPSQTANLTVDNALHAIQIELQYSSASSVADGAYRLWIDNPVQAAPDAAATGILLHSDVDPGSVKFGAYVNNGVYSDGDIAFEHSGFEIRDAFRAGFGA